MIYLYLPDLVEHLEDNLAGFKEERKDTKRFITKLFFAGQRHNKDNSALAISDNYLRATGHSPASFKKVNEKYNLYEVDKRYKQGKFSRRMYPNPIINEMLYSFNRSQRKKKVLELFKNQRGVFCERTAEIVLGSSVSVNNLTINPTPKVDVDNLLEWLTDAPSVTETEEIIAQRLLALASGDNLPEGCIPQTYHCKNGGRVTALGVSLQYAPKTIRKALLKGYWEYDLSNCHYTIMNQTGTYPTINDYVENTKEWRSTIAGELDITLTQAKKCLLALSYGATQGLNEQYHAIPNEIGADKAEKFWKHPQVNALATETKIAGANLVGMKVTDKELASKVAMRLQELENQILAAATKDIVIDVPIFDGFIYSGDLEVGVLEKNVLEVTGYAVKMTKERI